MTCYKVVATWGLCARQPAVTGRLSNLRLLSNLALARLEPRLEAGLRACAVGWSAGYLPSQRRSNLAPV